MQQYTYALARARAHAHTHTHTHTCVTHTHVSHTRTHRYTHRIGRTGRGVPGRACTFITTRDARRAAALVKKLQRDGQPVPGDLLALRDAHSPMVDPGAVKVGCTVLVALALVAVVAVNLLRPGRTGRPAADTGATGPAGEGAAAGWAQQLAARVSVVRR